MCADPLRAAFGCTERNPDYTISGVDPTSDGFCDPLMVTPKNRLGRAPGSEDSGDTDPSSQNALARAQAELVELRHLLAQAFKGRAHLDAQGHYIRVDQHYADIYGYGVDELVGAQWQETVHPDDHKIVLESYQRMLAAGRAEFDVRGVCQDGSTFDQYVVIVKAHDQDGQFNGHYCFIRAITEQAELRKLAEKALNESEERFRNLIEGSIQGIIIQRDWKPLFVNQAYADILGYDSPDEIIALDSIESQFAPYECPRLQRYKQARIRGEDAPTQYEYDALRKDGTIVTVHNTVRVVTWQGETAVQSTLIDVTDRKHAEEALRISEERYRALYDDNPSMFFTLDGDGAIVSTNRFGANELGYSVDELVGMSIFALHVEADQMTMRKRIETCLQDPDQVQRWEVGKLRKDGTVVWVRETARVVRDVDQQPVVLTVCEDITEVHNLSKRLSYQATHDPLTGLINRREFERRLLRALQTAQTDSKEHALCYLDLDQFKIINDTCGHVAGDELLRQLSAVLREKVRKRDTLARLGGDEFGVLVEHCSLEQAQRVAESVRDAIKRFRFLWGERSFNVSVSIGLVPITTTSGSITNVLSMADAACYVAKDKGANGIHISRQDDVELASRQKEMQWVEVINRALEQDRLHISRQPIVPIADGKKTGHFHELLVRMEDEDGNIVLPRNFMSAAERYNLTTELDRWVISSALKWLASHPLYVRDLFLCSINLSGHSLGDQKFLEFVIQQFDQTGVSPAKICFEVTETAAIANLTTASRFFKALGNSGCRFALDDFGSGLSSFAYLRNLPVDFLKIDGAFVKDIVDDPIALAMVCSINDIGHVMGKQTIAEFVENEAILRKLKEIGVDFAQGHAVGPPMRIVQGD